MWDPFSNEVILSGPKYLSNNFYLIDLADHVILAYFEKIKSTMKLYYIYMILNKI
jgi:hypothetical protein